MPRAGLRALLPARRAALTYRVSIPQLPAVQPEADGTLGGAAVEVIDEQDLYLLSHGGPGFSPGCCSALVDAVLGLG